MKFECETAATVSPAALKSVAKLRCHTRSPDTSLDRPYHTIAAAAVPGLGIDPKHLQRVFDAFYTTKSSGVGMGCRCATPSSMPMGAGCGQLRTNLEALYFSSPCPAHKRHSSILPRRLTRLESRAESPY